MEIGWSSVAPPQEHADQSGQQTKYGVMQPACGILVGLSIPAKEAAGNPWIEAGLWQHTHITACGTKQAVMNHLMMNGHDCRHRDLHQIPQSGARMSSDKIQGDRNHMPHCIDSITPGQERHKTGCLRQQQQQREAGSQHPPSPARGLLHHLHHLKIYCCYCCCCCCCCLLLTSPHEPSPDALAALAAAAAAAAFAIPHEPPSAAAGAGAAIPHEPPPVAAAAAAAIPRLPLPAAASGACPSAAALGSGFQNRAQAPTVRVEDLSNPRCEARCQGLHGSGLRTIRARGETTEQGGGA
eukprot:901566-Pelagomonas_calceolata.AAC.2